MNVAKQKGRLTSIKGSHHYVNLSGFITQNRNYILAFFFKRVNSLTILMNASITVYGSFYKFLIFFIFLEK
jgi:hypothetical protein